MTAAGGARVAPDRALPDIQAPVREALARVPDEMWRVAAADSELVGAVSGHLMGMRGKLFRPTLLLLASAVDDASPSDRAVHLAAVTELIHVATLVHDDSVDHSVLRRGRPTVNSVFSHQVSVIMGDFLYIRAMAALVDDGDMEVLRTVTRASTEMTLGELRQLSAYDALAFTEGDYERLIRAKTASLFSAACEVGAIVAGGDHRDTLARYGDRLGHAFQVVDDLLDFTSDEDTTGKPHRLDLREHKVTLPLIAALRTVTPAERHRVDALFAAPEPSDELIADVAAIIADRGGLEYARQRALAYAAEAEVALESLPAGSVRTALAEAIGYVLERRA